MTLLNESFEVGDLKNVLRPKFEVDVFKSKMGRDDKICVLNFFVTDREAAQDLVDFFERGYQFVLDADVSTAEVEKNCFAVFVEIRRLSTLFEHVQKLLSDLRGATGLKVAEWTFRYKKQRGFVPFEQKAWDAVVPVSPRAYRKLFQKPINDLKQAAGLPIETPPVEDNDLKALQNLAGI